MNCVFLAQWSVWHLLLLHRQVKSFEQLLTLHQLLELDGKSCLKRKLHQSVQVQMKVSSNQTIRMHADICKTESTASDSSQSWRIHPWGVLDKTMFSIRSTLWMNWKWDWRKTSCTVDLLKHWSSETGTKKCKNMFSFHNSKINTESMTNLLSRDSDKASRTWTGMIQTKKHSLFSLLSARTDYACVCPMTPIQHVTNVRRLEAKVKVCVKASWGENCVTA